MTEKELNARLEALQGFRDLISWYTNHPEIPLPDFNITNYAVNNPESTARALGTFEKVYSGDIVYFHKMFGPIKASYCFMRDQVCTKRVVGTKRVEAVFIPAHEEDIVEWDCNPVLAPQNANPTKD